MMRFPILLFVAVLLGLGCPSTVRADAVPHFERPHIIVQVEYGTSKPIKPSNVEILLPQRGTSTFDTVHVVSAGDYLSIEPLSGDTTGHVYLITGRGVSYEAFKLMFIMGKDTLMSPILHALYPGATIYLSITDSGIEDDSPIFEADWGTYFQFLLLTVLTECLLGLLFFKSDGVPYAKIWIIAAMNLISHPALWTLCTLILGFGTGKMFAELGVIVFEGWWIYHFLKEYYTFGTALKTSLVLNFVSYVLGGVVSLFTGVG
jgi:hypothetical protein